MYGHDPFLNEYRKFIAPQDLFDGLVNKTRKNLEPSKRFHQCHALLFTPLLYLPVDIPISCIEPLYSKVLICSKWERQVDGNQGSIFEIHRPTNKALYHGSHKCQPNWTPFNESCFKIKLVHQVMFDIAFVRNEQKVRSLRDTQFKNLDTLCRTNETNANAITFNDDTYHQLGVILDFLHLFHKHFPDIEFVALKRLVYNAWYVPYILLRYFKYYHTWETFPKPKANVRVRFVLCQQSPITFHESLLDLEILVQCGDGSFISDLFQCDGKNDCFDGGDEDNCPPVC